MKNKWKYCMIDVREFEVDVAYSVAKPTGMLEQKT
jgi:hypothetical protein